MRDLKGERETDRQTVAEREREGEREREREGGEGERERERIANYQNLKGAIPNI